MPEASFRRGGTLSKLRELIRATTGKRSTLLIACLAGVLFLGSWTTIHYGFYARHLLVDTPLYQHYADLVRAGEVPYRNFAIEYPPGALPVFIAPALKNSPTIGANTVRVDYRRHFEFLMAVCGLASIALAAIALRRLGASNGRALSALSLLALSPLMLGPVILSRFDLYPTMLALAGLVAILVGRERLGFAGLGLATATKIFPAVLLPIGCIWVWKRASRRELAACLGFFCAVLAVCFVPFAIIAPHGLWHSITVQLSRPLQIESLGAATLIALHHLIGLTVATVTGSGSQNLIGSGSGLIATLQTALQAAALLATWIWFARGEADGERLIRAGAASMVAFVAFGKVLSPQFMIWLIPFVLLVRGRRGITASSLLVAALVLTQLWFPSRYWSYALDYAAWPSAFVLLRDIVLVVLFATLLAGPLGRERGLHAARAAPIQPGT